MNENEKKTQEDYEEEFKKLVAQIEKEKTLRQ